MRALQRRGTDAVVARTGCLDRALRRVGVNVTGTRAITQLIHCVIQRYGGLRFDVLLRLEAVGVTRSA